MTFDPRAFRSALGAFPTGVTVITTMSEDGSPVGLTCSSFNSVSLDPPLVSWSLRKESRSLDAFLHSKRFAIHVLAADQESISRRFARSGDNKFAGFRYAISEHGTPAFRHCPARFECQTAHEYEGGDHVIFIGEVIKFDTVPGVPPLVFHSGYYASLENRIDPRDAQDASLSQDLTSPILSLLKQHREKNTHS